MTTSVSVDPDNLIQELNELNNSTTRDLAVAAGLPDLSIALNTTPNPLQAGQSFGETTLVEYLPRQFLPHYNLAFARRFLVAFLTVTWKLMDPEAVHNCANQAEELALYALIQATRDSLPLGEDDLDAFEEAVYEDSDFLLLFDPSKDGIAEAVATA